MPALQAVRKTKSENVVSGPIYLGTYIRHFNASCEFNIYVGNSQSFKPRDNYNYSLISLKSIPEIWCPNLRKPSNYTSKRAEADISMNIPTIIGCILYYVSANTAYSVLYDPVRWLAPKSASKMAYLIEANTTHILKEEGFKYISTGDYPNSNRRQQLERVSLPTLQEVKISEWLMGMGRGIRQKLEIYNDASLAQKA